jgi:hypothetical protein
VFRAYSVMETAHDIAAKALKKYPARRFAVDESGSTVAVWEEDRWFPVFAKMIDGTWGLAPRVMVNGESPWKAVAWTEVSIEELVDS